MNRISKIFGRKKRPTLKQLPLDDLKREQLTVQNELRKLENENDKKEKDEWQLKEEYKAAHVAGRDSLKRSVAQKLQNVQMRRTGLDTRLAYTNKMYQTVTGLLIIKENMAFFEKLGVGSVISDMDLGELENYVAEATIEGTLQQEKLAAMLQGINDGVSQLSGVSQDASIGDFMAELDAELIGSPVQQQTTRDMTDVMKTINAVAEMGADAARQMQQNVRPQQTSQNDPHQEKER
jgi:hypothetical protein